MRLQLAIALLLGTVLIGALPAGASRTESGYGQAGAGKVVSGVGEQWLATITACGTSSSICVVDSSTDLLLYINPDLNTPIDVTLDLATSFDLAGVNPPSSAADSPFGLIDCTNAQQSNIGSDQGIPGPCDFGLNMTPSTPTNGATPPGCTLPNPTPGAGITIVIPSSCLKGGEVFYFDLADTNNISITPGSTTVPEPSSLALLGAALFPLALLARRRREA